MAALHAAPNVSMWVKSEPFSYAAIPVSPHPRLSLNNLRKIIPYCRAKGKSGFPNLSYSVWRHIACNKLQLTQDLAWLYFSTCQLFSQSDAAKQWAKWDVRYSLATSQAEKDVLKNSLSVNTLQFVIFLYIQQLHKVSLKASLLAGDEWPSRARSPSLDMDSRYSTTSSKCLDEQRHLTFVQNNLTQILELLIGPDAYSGSTAGDFGLTTDAVDALGFLIAGYTQNTKAPMSIKEIALMQSLQNKTGYSKLTQTFSLHQFQAWLRNCLSQNPFGLSTCIATGRRLSWPMSDDNKVTGDHSMRGRGKIATNAHLVPKNLSKCNKLLIMSQVSKQTIARISSTLDDSSVKIHRCHYSYLYLLRPLRSVTIEKCRNTTIVLGPVETTIHMNHCENVTLIAPVRKLFVSGCTLCTLYILTPSRPLLLSGNDSILLAPYHTFYPSLDEQMLHAGLPDTHNLWDQPLCMGPDHREDTPVWELLPPDEFFIFTIPFEMDGDTQGIPGALPSQYQQAVNQRQKQMNSWQRLVKEAALTRPQKKEFQDLVEDRFHTWLAETGYKRELDSLVLPLQSSETK